VAVPPQGRPELSGSSPPDPSPPEPPTGDAPVDARVDAGEHVEEVTLEGLDLADRELDDLVLERCHLRTVTLTGAVGDGLIWRDVRLDGCELSGARFAHATLHRVAVSHGRGMGIVLADATARHVRFVECRLDGANVRTSDLEQCVFERCSLVEADFSGGKLTAVSFRDCDLSRAEFHNVRCERVQLERCTVDGLRGVAGLRGAVVGRDQVIPLAMCAFAALGITVADDETDS
jgi:uncharacterized protein YjbI with pentapeptide repeats